MDRQFSLRQLQIERWLNREGEFSEINAIIRPLLEKLDDDALTDIQWKALMDRIEVLNTHAKRVSEAKQELARIIADYPIR